MRVWGRMEDFLNNFRIKMKLQILYLFCVLLPLIATDSVIIYIAMQSAVTTRQHNMENVASAVQYNFMSYADNAARTSRTIYTNKYINRFLEEEYTSPLDYFTSYQNFVKDTLFQSAIGYSGVLTMYAKNDSIVKGGLFNQTEAIQASEWYRYLQLSGLDEIFYYYYDHGRFPESFRTRKLIFAKRMDYYGDTRKKVVRLELDYSALVQNMVKMNYEMPVYICSGDTILVSNYGENNIMQDFKKFHYDDRVGFTKEMNVYGMNLEIKVLEPEVTVQKNLADKLPVILILILINIILPLLLMKTINRSFTVRLRELSGAFKRVDDEILTEIKNVRGKDEIGILMSNYNRMVSRTNKLIQIVYKNKLKEQEMDIARQNAELLALHSQINPHFLFNALESIRMHSILKEEFETANMVEQLAIMERQNVEWGEDCVEIQKEMEFVKAYLELQKYRFGDRLSYELEVEENCRTLEIPKLTLVTFVENACIHGIESKPSPGWIFVRAYQEKEELCLEIEDTGTGMNEEFRRELQDKMQNANIESLKKKGRVGIVNACLRLKMVTKGEAKFELEGEEGVGTMVLIRIPIAYV